MMSYFILKLRCTSVIIVHIAVVFAACGSLVYSCASNVAPTIHNGWA